MNWLKKGFKSVTSWTKDTGKKVIDDVGEAGEDAVEFVKDVGGEVGSKIGKGASTVASEAGDFGKKAFDEISGIVDQIGDKLPKLPSMPSIKGATGQDFIEEKRAWIDQYVKDNSELIKQAIKVAAALEPYRDDIKYARKSLSVVSSEAQCHSLVKGRIQEEVQ